MAKDYYKSLGVERTASADEIKKSYRTLSKRYHPDLQNGKSDEEKKTAEEKFKEINEAYSVLSDPDKKRNYDQTGSADNIPHGFGGGGFDPMSFFRKHFHSAFGDFDFGFGPGGGMGSRNYNPDAPRRGKDVSIELEISFEEAIYGVNKKFDIQFTELCHSCNGTGADNNETIPCPRCGGTGRITRQFGGSGTLQTICSHCEATGRIPKNVCHVCHGTKTETVKHNINIIIPPGVDNGDTLKVGGEGEHGINGGQNGDLYISMRVTGNSIYKRAGNHLQTIFYVPSTSIGITDKINVHTPWGYVKVDIPKKCEADGTLLVKIPGYGIRKKNVSGDLYVQVIPEPIANLTNEQKKLLKKLNETIEMSNTPLRQKLDMDVRKFNDNAMAFKK